MARQVWKYTLERFGPSSLSVPIGAEILSVQVQGASVAMWALVDPSAPLVVRSFLLAGTGHDLPDGGLVHRGTVLDGVFVWHVFERLTVAAA